MKLCMRGAFLPDTDLWHYWHFEIEETPEDFMRFWERQRSEHRMIQIEMADEEI